MSDGTSSRGGKWIKSSYPERDDEGMTLEAEKGKSSSEEKETGLRN